jgi:hypothetical protein
VPETEQDFAKGTFFQLTPFGWFNLSWTEPGQVTVTSPKLAPDGNAPPPVTIAVRADQQQRLQSLLGQVAEPPAAARGSYVLDLKPGEAGARRLVWSPHEESAQLAQLRSDLDQTGHLSYHVAAHALARGRNEAERGEDEHACPTYLAGLDALGDRYFSPGLLDDTGMKLILARDNVREHRFKAAALMLERILEARLQVYVEREASASRR